MSRYAFAEDRSTYVREQLLETTDGAEAAKDIAASTLKVYFRGFASPTGALLINQELSKVQITGGSYVDSGAEYSGVEGYVRITTSYARVTFRLVIPAHKLMQ